MKKKAILALTLAGLVALQMPMTALAENTHQHNGGGENQDVTATGDKIAITVAGDVNCTVKNITAENAKAIEASNGATVTADSATNNAYAETVKAEEDAKVTVNGAVENKKGYVIKASGGATVNAGSATNNNTDFQTVEAFGQGTIVSIKAKEGVTGATGAVTNNGAGSAILASTGATVTADSATNNSGSNYIESYATVAATGIAGEADPDKQTKVTVTGAVTNEGQSFAISAGNGVIVTAGSATNGVAGQDESSATIKAFDAGTTVIIEAKDGVAGATGDVTNKSGANSAVWVQSGTTVVIEGTAKNNDAGEGTVCCDGGKVIVYKLENTANSSNLIDQDSSDASNIYYIIKGTDSEGIDLAKTTGLTSQTVLAGTTYEKTYQTAKGDEEIKIAVESGYEVKAGTIEVTKNADGTYSIKVPVGGGVTLETIKKAVEAAQTAEAEEKKATVTGSEGNAVGGGSWNVAPDGTWTYRNNGIFKDTWGYITLANGKTGWFWFDKNGVMATGWKKINDKWYYFNKEKDGTQGMMLVNTTTPDGFKVGADGAWIQ